MLSVKISVKDPNGNIQRRTASKTSPINIPVCSKILAIPNPGLEPVLAAAEINTKGWNICVMIVIVALPCSAKWAAHNKCQANGYRYVSGA